MIIKHLANVFENPNHGAFGRTISLALRHGTPIQYIVEQLNKDKNSDITSFSKVISRVLKSYIKDGTEATSEKKCPTCEQDTVIYQEGCLLCTSCGWSRC
jgi:ribonucleoside-diphosphate reductase alpha chain